MLITIWSHFAESPEWRIARSYEGMSVDPTWTGEAPADNLEEIFHLFNRGHSETCDKFMESIDYTLGSLSAGDVVTVWIGGDDPHHFLVAAVGYKQITEDQFQALRADPHRAWISI